VIGLSDSVTLFIVSQHTIKNRFTKFLYIQLDKVGVIFDGEHRL